MTSAFTAFMTGLIDYAGLFPPAGLGIGPAVTEYARHRAQRESWMLGRFIAPAEKLGAIAAAADQAAAAAGRVPPGAAAPWPFSVLVGGRTGADDALAALPGQGRSVAAFVAGGGRVEVLECPLPANCCAQETGLRLFLDRLAAALCAAGLTGRDLFLELPDVATGPADPVGSTDPADARVLAAIDALRRDSAGDPHFPRIGAKLRCGGLRPEAFPPAGRVASVLQTCAALRIPLKCTAGLHHPLRHRAQEPAVMMHGFLNVMGAGYLAHGAALQGRGLQECLEETDPRAFAFGAGGFSWRGHAVAVPELAALRRDFVCGFGSCSFAEPVADLAELGWL